MTDRERASDEWERGSYCCVEGGHSCMCGTEERTLRQHIAGAATRPLTDNQRRWCRTEVGRVEGHSEADCDGLSDADLSRLVLSAWTDFCRDKGLL